MKSDDESYLRTTSGGGARIADLVADPALDTRVVAGADGLDRPVLWAHTCETPEPTRWLGPNELLMTMGACVPSGSRAQRDFIAGLDQAGLAGMTVGEEVVSPRYTQALLDEADRRGFPVLFTGPRTPFAALGRAVAAASVDEQTARVLLLSRLYQRTNSQDRQERRSGRGLRDIFHTTISVVDEATGCVVIGEQPVELVPESSGSHRRPLRTQRPTHVLIGDPSRLDAFALVHLSQVLEVDANAILQDAERDAHRGSDVFTAWLSDRELFATTSALEDIWGHGRTAYRVVASRTSRVARAHLALALSDVPALTLDTGAGLLTACRDSDLARVRQLLEVVADECGVSDLHSTLEEAGAAVAEATSALDSAGPAHSWQVFDAEHISLLPRSRREARTLIDAVLGPLSDDGARMTGLRTTLFAFLDNDLRWQATADQLGIHRQTLVYRLQQVEAATGRDIRTTKDIAELWLARTAWARFEGQPPRGPGRERRHRPTDT
jgi:PucR family transcriptional regulator, purine catabolism regulatory protein